MKSKLFFIVVLFLFSSYFLFSQKNTLRYTGDVLQIGLPAIALSFELLEKDKAGVKQELLAFGTNFILTHGLKRLINKPRPNNNGNFAFPSGHTSTAFQGASFIYIKKGWKYGLPALLAASLVGYSRIDADKHDFADVLAGAILGSLSSYVWTRTNNDKAQISVSGSGFGILYVL